MCGIAGFLYPKNQSLFQVNIDLESMSDAVARRGPDSHGTLVEDNLSLALAHRRLSIHDLSLAGSQPMSSPSGRYVIVFNGEIYNHKHMRREISKKNSHFHWKSSSDTEVLLNLIEIEGLDATLQMIDGMFAFALVDRQASDLYLVRDRLGEKPLYYGWHNNHFLFASNINSIMSHSAVTPRVSQSAADLFVRYGYIPNPLSILEETSKLSPGNYLKLDLQQRCIVYIKAYYDRSKALATSEQKKIHSMDKAKSQLRRSLIDVINDLSYSDVPLGVLLSSGNDSALVASILKSEVAPQVDSFTLGFHESERDESQDALKIAEHLNLNHHQKTISSDDALTVLNRLNQICSDPLGDPSILPTSIICQFARQKVTVCLSGDGADELFAGYSHYNHHRITYLWQKLSLLPSRTKSRIVNKLISFKQLLSGTSSIGYLNRLSARLGSSVDTLMTLLISDDYRDLYKFLNSQWRPYGLLQASTSNICSFGPQSDLVPRGLKPYILQSMLIDCLMYLPDCILHKTDSASMYFGLEVRAPFLHRRIVELAGATHQSLKIKNNKSKFILKELLYDYIPKHMVDRPKKGFGIPLSSWLRGPLAEWSYDLIMSPVVDQIGLNREIILEAWKEHAASIKNNGKALWNVLVLLSWYECNESRLTHHNLR